MDVCRAGLWKLLSIRFLLLPDKWYSIQPDLVVSWQFLRTRLGTSYYTLSSGVLTRSKKTDNDLVEGTLIVALAEQVEGAVLQWKPDQERHSHLGVEAEVCELKRYRIPARLCQIFPLYRDCTLPLTIQPPPLGRWQPSHPNSKGRHQLPHINFSRRRTAKVHKRARRVSAKL